MLTAAQIQPVCDDKSIMRSVSPSCVSLLYASLATRPFSPDELRELLQAARANNHRLGITGLLIYSDGHFMQELEGPAEAVEELFRKIAADSRHTSVTRLFTRPMEVRQFGDWSMAFRDLGETSTDAIPGYNGLLNRPLDQLKENPEQAGKLVEDVRRSL